MTEQQEKEFQIHRETLNEHSLMLQNIDRSMLSLSENIKDLVMSVKEITTSINDIKLINLRIANVEKETRETFKRVFTEINKFKVNCGEYPSYKKTIENLDEESKLGIRPLTLKNLLIYGVVAIISYASYLTITLQHVQNRSNLLDDKEMLILSRVTKTLDKITNIHLSIGTKSNNNNIR